MLNLKQRRQKSNMSGQRPFLILALILFIVTALFPFGWLATVWPGFSDVANFIFGTQISHIIGHFAVFVLMGGGVLLLFPSLRQRFWLYFGLMLLLGITQEFLQIASFKHIIPAFDEVLDLTMDMSGAATAFYIWRKQIENGD
ncbi:hypothetical protein [Candidatus Leptofilum sp.]|uniref:hypothetical protein n=1 Tax=Candidatus Leptofilum sp. TaxID=3241576 RepID=UPI003B58E33A